MAVKLLKNCRYPRDHFALICIKHVLRRNGRAGADWGFVMSGSAWAAALCQSRGSVDLGLYRRIQIKIKQGQTSSCLSWLSLSRVIFFLPLTCGIVLILLLVMSFTFAQGMLIYFGLMLFTRRTRGNNKVTDPGTFPSYSFKLQRGCNWAHRLH